MAADRRDEARTLMAYHDNIETVAKIMNVKTSTVERHLRKDSRIDGPITFSTKNVLLFDIETAPIQAYVWNIWKENIGQQQIVSDWCILSFAAKWLGEDEIIYHDLPGCRGYEPGSKDDSLLLRELWKLLNEADIVVAHNGDRFDIPKVNARFIKNGMVPPAPYKSIDTLKVAKRHFKFTSNRLDYIGSFLNIGRKLEHSGFELWSGCLAGDPKCWATMEKYNIQDVMLLEQVYLRLQPWANNLPSIASDYNCERCPGCGSDNLTEGGAVYTQVSEFTSYRCNECGRWMRNAINRKGKQEMMSTMRNVQ